jgi:hypothetical protein
MSWYFDTENYASGIWNSWRKHERMSGEAMVRGQRGTGAEQRARLCVHPPGIEEGADFGRGSSGHWGG